MPKLATDAEKGVQRRFLILIFLRLKIYGLFLHSHKAGDLCVASKHAEAGRVHTVSGERLVRTKVPCWRQPKGTVGVKERAPLGFLPTGGSDLRIVIELVVGTTLDSSGAQMVRCVRRLKSSVPAMANMTALSPPCHWLVSATLDAWNEFPWSAE